MEMREEFATAREQWKLLTFYQKFEQVIVVILTGLMAAVILMAVWTLTLKIVASFLLSGKLDLTDYAVFQTIFGMILTVIIALEFKRSLLVVAERRESIVQVRTVILLALLAIVRKLIILDMSSTNASQLFALAAAILALGGVYWLIRDQDSRERTKALQQSSVNQ